MGVKINLLLLLLQGYPERKINKIERHPTKFFFKMFACFIVLSKMLIRRKSQRWHLKSAPKKNIFYYTISQKTHVHRVIRVLIGKKFMSKDLFGPNFFVFLYIFKYLSPIKKAYSTMELIYFKVEYFSEKCLENLCIHSVFSG